MTSRFISQMLSFDLLDKHEQQSYVLSVTAYMVAGGFHSLHEVLGPIAHCLQEESLIPGYISEPLLVRGERQTPNFNVFYALMESLDPEVAIIR